MAEELRGWVHDEYEVNICKSTGIYKRQLSAWTNACGKAVSVEWTIEGSQTYWWNDGFMIAQEVAPDSY